MAAVMRLPSPGASTCVCSGNVSSSLELGREPVPFSVRGTYESAEVSGHKWLRSAYSDQTPAGTLVCKSNKSVKSRSSSTLYSRWRTPSAAEEGSRFRVSASSDASATSAPSFVFLVDVDEERDGSLVFRFGTVDQVLAWDRLVSFIYDGANDESDFNRASAVCRELLGIAEFSHSGPTFYSGTAGTVPRWAMMNEMLKDLGHSVAPQAERSASFMPDNTLETAGVWQRSDGIYGLGGGIRPGRPGRWYQGGLEHNTISSLQAPRFEMVDWGTLPLFAQQARLRRDEVQVYARHPALSAGTHQNLFEAPRREGVLELNRQSESDNSNNRQAPLAAVLSSTAFIWLPRQDNEKPAVHVDRATSRAAKLKVMGAKRLAAAKASGRVSGTKRSPHKSVARAAVKGEPKVHGRRATIKPRDLFHKNPLQVVDFLLGQPFVQTKCSNAEFLLAMRKEYAQELAVCLNQFAVGLAGGGLAMILYVASRMLSVNAIFDNGKLIIIIRGVCMLWLAAAMRSLRKVILSLKNDCVSLATKARDSQQVARLKKELKALSYKALGVMFVSVVVL